MITTLIISSNCPIRWRK